MFVASHQGLSMGPPCSRWWGEGHLTDPIPHAVCNGGLSLSCFFWTPEFPLSLQWDPSLISSSRPIHGIISW